MNFKNIKLTPAEALLWHAFLAAVGAALTAGVVAAYQYMTTSNIDPNTCIKLALAAIVASFIASISTQMKNNGNILQAILDLLGQVHEIVSTTTIQGQVPLQGTPQPVVLQPRASVVSHAAPFVPNTSAAASPNPTTISFGDTGIVPTIPKQG